ncbi:Uncharacterised protein [Yersinia intermedia]|uniref:hypothetical protein n=1 Tax=Yersinia intermedia TaxID=631 RepID=UPI0005E56ACD|nr:hypothetical protein [Yersinia intermedia]CNC11519.1 Uncharacterised protein [Yersinia intermedia]CNG27590.1 Uncharacterised protein [Yersinia intermedia]
MTGSEFLLPMTVGAAISWACFNVVAQLVSKRQVRAHQAISWGCLATLSLVLSVCAFSLASAEHQATKQVVLCSDNSPECYAKSHHNPVSSCKQVMDNKAVFHHVWLDNVAQPIFNNYLWHDEKKKTIQAFGHQANAINSLGMLTPLQYFCIFNANTGEIIVASFE